MTDYLGFTKEELAKYEKEIMPMLRAMPKGEAGKYLKENKRVAMMMFAHIAMCKDETCDIISRD